MSKRRTIPFPVVISGPSGAGKTTIVDKMLERDPLLRESVSATTRPPRDGEVEGDSYFFVSKSEFEDLEDGKLVEWAEVHGNKYGTPKSFVDKELKSGVDVVMNIDVQGGASVRGCFSDAVLIFILPPSLGELEQRIRGRGTDDSEEIHIRMENARGEIALAADYDYIVVNDEVDACADEILAIIRAERARRERYPGGFIKDFANE